MKDVVFHIYKEVCKTCRKSTHRVADQWEAVSKVLSTNPDYGCVIPGQGGLRKMRVRTSKFGKSGGYRLIYKSAIVDEIHRIALLCLYFKGEKEDLSAVEYQKYRAIAEEIFSDDKIQWCKADELKCDQ